MGVEFIRAYEYDEKTPSDDHLARLVAALGAELTTGLEVMQRERYAA